MKNGLKKVLIVSALFIFSVPVIAQAALYYQTSRSGYKFEGYYYLLDPTNSGDGGYYARGRAAKLNISGGFEGIYKYEAESYFKEGSTKYNSSFDYGVNWAQINSSIPGTKTNRVVTRVNDNSGWKSYYQQSYVSGGSVNYYYNE